MSNAQTAPKVAIITPVYNGEAFIEETLRCVQEQTYPNIVHVINDNACKDATPEIIERFKNGRVPLLVARNPETVPICDNFNLAMARLPVDADYVMILCADDVLMPDAVERMVAAAQADPQITAVSGHALCLGNVHDHQWPEGPIDGREAVRRFFSGLSALTGLFVLFKVTHPHPQPFYNSQLLAFDLAAALRACENGKFAYVHEVVADMRIHPQAVSSFQLLVKNTHFRDHLAMLDDFGPRMFSQSELKILRRGFVRHYARRLSAWALLYGKWDVVRQHMDYARERGRPITVYDFAESWIDRVLCVIGVRQRWELTAARRLFLFEAIPPPDVVARRTAKA